MSDDLSGFSLIDLFRSEAEELVTNLSSGLLGLEQGGEANSSTLEGMMRSAHSLKGAARIVDLHPAVKVAHALEDCFVAAQEGKLAIGPTQVDTLLRAVDLLSELTLLAEGTAIHWEIDNQERLDTIVASVVGVTKGSPSPSPATPTVALNPEPPSLPTPPSSPEPEPSPAPEPKAVLAPVARAEPVESTPAPPPAPRESGAMAESSDRVVRVTAESLTRLMSLAGESLVQSHQLRPIVEALTGLRAQQVSLLATVQSLQDRQSSPDDPESAIEAEMISKLKSQANHCSQILLERIEQVEDFTRRSEDLAGRLHHEVLTSRMRPLADGIKGFPRMVRDVSRQLGKKVQFEVIGENTGVDRDILEKLEAPLNHLIRNGLDHAIESPEVRQELGKPETGVIRLEARHRAGMLQLSLTDDGKGIDLESLQAKVLERGLATAAMVGQMSEAELLEFLFLPGFSTKEKVTEISGRGVGLDVVQNMVRAVGGFVRVSSRLGEGTRFTLQLPITMSVVRALLVRISGEPYAFPLNRIDRILSLPRKSIQVLEGRQHFAMEGQPVGLVEASQVLELPTVSGNGDQVPVVVASDRSHRFGVVVDAFLGERDLEVRPLDRRLGKVPNINSASILEDGWPVLIIDVEDLIRSVDNMLGGRRLHQLSSMASQATAAGPRRVLVVDDSLTVRELERQLLEAGGYKVEVAVDGVDGWNAVQSSEYDLVVSDVDMPRMDGIALVTRIKQDTRLRSIPVVIVSYKDREEDRMRGLDAGANAYLTKSSFHDKTFLRTVIDLIGEAGR